MELRGLALNMLRNKEGVLFFRGNRGMIMFRALRRKDQKNRAEDFLKIVRAELDE